MFNYPKRILLLVLVLLFTVTFTYIGSAYNSNQFLEQPLELYEMETYVETTLSKISGKPVVASNPIPLMSLVDDSIIAYSFTINETGFAVINLADWSINEYALSGCTLYEPSDLNYYGGIFQHYVKKGSNFVRIENNSVIKLDAKLVMNEYNNIHKERSKAEKKLLQESMNNIKYATTESGALSSTTEYTTSTVITNNHCGPTAMAIMTEYYKRVHGVYIPGYTSFLALVIDLTDYVEPTNLSILRNGMNTYFTTKGIPLIAYSKSSFSMSTVKSKINSNEPITLGGAASIFGNSSSAGHVTTIIEYNIYTDPSSYTHTTLTVNTGWGYDYNISWIGANYPWTKADHIYFYMD